MLIDANIFLEVLLAQKKSENCKAFLRKVFTGEKQAFISTFSLDSISLSILRRDGSKEKVKIFLESLARYKGLKFYQVKISDRVNCLKLMQSYSLDYEDAIVLQSAISTGSSEILSFDKDFDGVKEIKRVEP